MAIKNLMIERIHEVFPECEIYGETIEQGFVSPCFSVRQINGGLSPRIDKTYYKFEVFDVRYFPAGERPKEECRETAEKLIFALEELMQTRGTNMEWEITDDVLHFFIRYHSFLRKTKDREAMEDLHLKNTTGGTK